MKFWFSIFTLIVLPTTSSYGSADQVRIPLQVNHALMRKVLIQEVYTGPNETARVWDDGTGCNYLVLSKPIVNTHAGRLRIVSSGEAKVGTAVGQQCLLLKDWHGTIEVLQEATVEPDSAVIHFHTVESNLYETDGRKAITTGVLWDWVKGHVHPRLAAVVVDWREATTELRKLLPVILPAHNRAEVEAILDSLSLREVTANSEGLTVTLQFEIPEKHLSPESAEPEPALTQAELERWDAFLTFVIERAAEDSQFEKLRDALLEVLLDARYELREALTMGSATATDPVQQLFVKTWVRLAPVLRRVSTDLPNTTAMHYLSFIAAADALMAINQLGPAIGLEISADGLRRLARIVARKNGEDPLSYGTDVDPQLRQLFGFGQPLPLPKPRPPAHSSRWLWRLAWAAEATDSELLARLNRWVPSPSEIEMYLQLVRNLLLRTADNTLSENQLDKAFSTLYRDILLATAWQETCWRQFVEKGGIIEPIRSATGDVGILQINKKVWRGFYDVKALQGDIAYNAAAGSEILIHYLVDYAIKKGEHKKTGSVDNLARATYALYNGGPRHLRRYREAKTPKSLQTVDAAFWEKYQAIRAGNELAVTQCYGHSIPALQTSARQPDRVVSSPRAEPQRDTSHPQKHTTRTNHPANSAAKSVKREPWVLKQNPRYYTLQLTAAQDEQAILDYIYKSRLAAANVAYYRFLRQGQPWFAVVYGAFATRSEADRAASRLQADLQQASPWIREFSSVQEAIRESNSLSMNLFEFSE